MNTDRTAWYARKPYLHFDQPLSEAAAIKYVSDPERVASHPFYPLLSYSLITPRIKKAGPDSPKPFINNSKERPIAYPAHKDGYIFAYYKSLLEELYESWLAENGMTEAVTAFRSNVGNNITLSKKSFDFIKANQGCMIIATDVEGFFDNIDHQQLKAIWTRFLGSDRLPDDHFAVYKAITRYSVVERHKAYNLFGIRLSQRHTRNQRQQRLCTARQFRSKVIPRGLVKPNPGLSKGVGIPQGTQLSPLLSNMYMAYLDYAMNEWITKLGGRYWRYCDDVLIVIPSDDGGETLSRLDHELQRLSLNRSASKTQKLHSSDLSQRRQLQYLGFMFNGTDAVIRPSSIHRYHRNLKKAIRATEFRRQRESKPNMPAAPLRQQALYNMYSELPTRGKNAIARKLRRKFSGNFIDYMDKSAAVMDSPRIARQRSRVLRRFRTAIKRRTS